MNRRVGLSIGVAAGLIGAAWLGYTFWPGVPDPAPPPPFVDGKGKEPEVVKPVVFEPAPVSLADASAHIYQGKSAVQVGVKENAIEARRAAVLTGRVLTREGKALAGVKVHVAHHPELGSTQTQTDGVFHLVVNGGGQHCIHYQKEGHLPLCRVVNVPWQDRAWLPDVALIPVDAQVTPIDLTSAEPIQVARGSVVKDQDGERRATVFIPQGTKAQMILPDKSLKALDSIKVRITEYTVGPNGPAAMPAALPPTSAYTYAFELSADEVLAGGIKVSGKDLLLSQPVIVFVENFLKFPVGTPMPMGYFDNDRAAWIAAENGRVIELLPAKGELAAIDIDGAGKAADSATLKKHGISDAERKQLAALYKPGQSLWRAAVRHFSTHDLNQAPGDAQGPDCGGGENGRNRPCGPQTEGSVIDIHNQVLGEDVALVGIPFRLHYRSNRAAGHGTSRSLKIPLTGGQLPKSLKRIDLEIYIAGQKHVQAFPPQAKLTHTFLWDGKDAQGRALAGAQPVKIRLGWVFDAVYQVPERFGEPPVRPTPTRSRQELTYWRDETMTIGNLDGRAAGLGGWSLSVHHCYDPVGRVLYLGSGGVRGGTGWGNQSIHQGIATVAGGGAKRALGNGGPALEARLDDIRPDRGAGMLRDRPIRYPRGLAVGPDGSIYIADANDQVRKVTPDGVIQTIAGGGKKTPKTGLKADEVEFAYRALGSLALGPDGSLFVVEAGQSRIWRVAPDGVLSHFAGSGHGFSGDGGPATKAKLAYPAAIAIAADGSAYIADTGNHRIRRIGPDGIITTVAGTGQKGYAGDGGPAREARFYHPTGLALTPDGTLTIADAGNYVIRRLTPGGGLSTVAGLSRADWTHAFAGDGGPARKASLDEPAGIAVGPDGALYIADTDNHRIRRVGLDGVIATLAGTQVKDVKKGDFAGDGGPAVQAALSFPSALAFGPDGSLYVYDGYLRAEVSGFQHRIRRIAPALPGFTDQDIALLSEDGRELYKFDASGRHRETLNALTGRMIHRFEYDAGGRLTKVHDAFANVTTIERDVDGHPLALVAPRGQRTELTIDASGYLAKVTNPAEEYAEFTYYPGGLLASFRNTRGHSSRFTYDALGRLTRDEDAGGGFTALARTDSPRGYEIALTTALKPATTYTVNDSAAGAEERLEKCCCGAETRTAFALPRSHDVRHADGMTTTVTLQPDPRWGMQSPLLKQATLTTPGGLKFEMSLRRTANLAMPNNPLSLQNLVDAYTLNGRKFTNTWDVAKRTLVRVSPAGRTSTTSYDEHYRIAKMESPGVAAVYYDYDTRGRIVAIRQGEGVAQRSVHFEFDADGNVSTVTDPLKRTLRLEFDRAGRLVKQTLSDQREVAYVFDPAGNLHSLTPPGKAAHVFEHTPVNLVGKVSLPTADVGPCDTVYEFDRDRKLMKTIRPDGKTIDFAYSKAGLIESLTFPGRELRYTFDPKTEQLRNIAGMDASLAFRYDGFLLTETRWSGQVKGSVKRTYDKDFRLASIHVNGDAPIALQYDADGLLTQAGALLFERHPATGFLTGTKLAGVSTAVEYSPFGERKKFAARFGGEDLIVIDYERDALGRIVKKTETIDGKTDVHAYAYDDAGRMKTASRNGKVVGAYEYDTNGNRTKYEGQRGSFAASHDAQDRIRNDGAFTFTHNAQGELETKSDAGQATSFDYDALGNLLAVRLPDGGAIEYVLDAAHRRVGRKVNGTLTQGFLYQGPLRPIAELDGKGNILSRFIYGDRVNVPEFMEKKGTTYRIVADHLGSPRLVVDAKDGTIVQRIDYDEFGNVLSDTNPGFQPFGFAGGLHDPRTGLVHFGARVYDPAAGRWTTRDPIGFAGGDANLYAYVRNDPQNRVDPAGLDSPSSSEQPRSRWVRPPWYESYVTDFNTRWRPPFDRLGDRYKKGWTIYDWYDPCPTQPGDTYRRRLSFGASGHGDRLGGFGQTDVSFGTGTDRWTDTWTSQNPHSPDNAPAPAITIRLEWWERGQN